MDAIINPKDTELEMLNAFYNAWVKLHTAKATEDYDAMLELSRNLVEAAHVVAEFRKGIQ